MKIYFSAPLAGREELDKNYKAIVNVLKEWGHNVVADHVLKEDSAKLESVTDSYRFQYYKRMVKWISESDLIVAELSHPSGSIGHEVTIALEKDKPVIALYFKGRGPQILLGIKSDKLQIVKYDLDNLKIQLEKALSKSKGKMDIRFNFFVSPEINEYLDWISRVKRTPRAVYLRDLLEKDMAKTKDFKKD